MARHGIPTARYRVCASSAEARAVIALGRVRFSGRAEGGRARGRQGRRRRGRPRRGRRRDPRRDGRAAVRRRGRAPRHRGVSRRTGSVVLRACATARARFPLTSAQDHKRIFDGDQGPNTGGMGAFAPSPLLDASMQAAVMAAIIDPVLRGMRAEGTEYRGFLYAGLMMTCAGPKVIEYNVRFGDPEAQAVMPLLDGELLPLLAAAADGDLGDRARRAEERRLGRRRARVGGLSGSGHDRRADRRARPGVADAGRDDLPLGHRAGRPAHRHRRRPRADGGRDRRAPTRTRSIARTRAFRR